MENKQKLNNPYLTLIETLSIASIGGIFFWFIHVPMPWLLGPLTTVLFWRITTGRSLNLPPICFNMALLLLGYLLGSSFTKETSIQIVKQLPLMVITTTIIVLISLGLAVFTARRTKLDMASMVMGSVPGGLFQMLAICQEIKGLDATVVVFIQMIRVLSVTFIVPFLTIHGIGGDFNPLQETPSLDSTFDTHWYSYILSGLVAIFGYIIGKRIGLPTSGLTGPLIATALVMNMGGETAPLLPSSIVLLSQIAIGIHIGLIVKPQIFRSHNMEKFGAYTLVGSILLILSSLLLAFVLTMLSPMSLATAFLSTAPGGIAETGLTATAVHADLSMVSGYQLFRVLFILFVVTPILKRWVIKKKKWSVDDVQHKTIS